MNIMAQVINITPGQAKNQRNTWYKGRTASPKITGTQTPTSVPAVRLKGCHILSNPAH